MTAAPLPPPLSDLAHQMLDAALKAGADAADVLAIDGTSVSIDVLGGALEHAERSEGREIGLRVLVGQRQASVSASDTRSETFAEVAARAVAMAREAPEDATVGLADPADLATDLDMARLELADPGPEPAAEALEESARAAEAAALAVPGVTQMDAARAGFWTREGHLAASNGFSAGYRRSERYLSAVAIAGEGTGMERDYHVDARVFQDDMTSPEEIGRIAGERAVARHGARKPKTGAWPVIFDERVAGTLIGHLLQAVSGTAVARGASWLRDALGEAVLPPGLSLLEEPHRPRTSGSRLFDAEGLPTRPRAIVRDGTLTGWTLDLGTARKLGLDSTANAFRSPGGTPSPSVSNIRLTEGECDRAALLSEMGTGLLVTSMIGSTINPTTGDYSRGAAGYWVENGTPLYPVNECTIAGNLRQMMMSIVPANDARRHLSRVVPSLLVEGLTIAGE